MRRKSAVAKSKEAPGRAGRLMLSADRLSVLQTAFGPKGVLAALDL
jgi:hypothetical protein